MKQLSGSADWERQDGRLINPDSAIPMYMQIFEHLQAQILDGDIGNDEKLPSEKELGKLFNVSRITVRQALNMLEKKGLTFSVQGKGTFARRAIVDQNLMQIISFGASLQEKKLDGTTVLLDYRDDVKRSEADWPVELANWQESCRLELLGMVAGQSAVHYCSYIRPDIGARIYSIAREHVEQGHVFSTFSLYEEIGCRINHIKQTIFAKEADPELGKILKIAEGKALLMMKSLVYDKDSSVIEYKIAHYRTDRYSFSLLRENVLGL